MIISKGVCIYKKLVAVAALNDLEESKEGNEVGVSSYFHSSFSPFSNHCGGL